MLIFAFLGAAIAVLTGLVNNSQRRLIVTASVTLIVAFFAFPFSEAIGALTRHDINPTPFGLIFIFPWFAIILLTGIAGLVFYNAKPKILSLLSVVLGLASLVASLVWLSQSASVVAQQPLYGLMEALTGMALFVIVAGFSWPNKNIRSPMLIIGLVLGIGSFLWLNSDAGHAILPEAEGYYKLFRSTSPETAEAIVVNFNESLEALNRQRQTLGMSELEPLESVAALETNRLPRAAADSIEEGGLGLRLVRPSQSGYGTPLIFFMAGLLVGSGVMLSARKHLVATNDFSLGIMFSLVLLALVPAFAATEFSVNRFVEGLPFLRNFLDRAWPPAPEAIKEVAEQILLTVEIALVGTFLAALFAIPLSFLASRNLTQGNWFMKTVFALTRAFFNIDRGVDTLILALVFVSAVGLGPFAGVLAMAIHSIADLGKVYSETIENVEKGPIEALESVGASGSNVVRWAILPQVMPLFVGWTLYRFEINFRVSIVIGLVGAGGIGFFIKEKMGNGSWDEMMVGIIAIVIVVNIIDFASSWLRSRLV